ncbi:hypothetical protein EDB89DRAFT_417344 [Lactarius sanguifluus]|nr:hypothetical protein EDB89DRAFT_417344 [Lactarius sanguifluus]
MAGAAVGVPTPSSDSLISFGWPSTSLSAPAAPSARVRVAHLHAVDLSLLEVLLRHHRVAAAAARHLTHHETTNGTARVEGATAVAHRPGEDVSARRRVGALPVGALTRLVADAVQAHVNRSRSRGAENGRGAKRPPSRSRSRTRSPSQRRHHDEVKPVFAKARTYEACVMSTGPRTGTPDDSQDALTHMLLTFTDMRICLVAYIGSMNVTEQGFAQHSVEREATPRV